MKYYPELYEDTDIEELVDKVYKRCFGHCTECALKDDIEEDVCIPGVLFELWRHWKNLKGEENGIN